MIDKKIKERIQLRAWEIYEWRKENNEQFIVDEQGNLREITAQDNWLLAEKEILGKEEAND